MSNVYFSQEQITTSLFALAAWAGSSSRAAEYLKNEKGISISQSTLHAWKTKHGEEYDRIRTDYASQLEDRLVHEMREVAGLAIQAEKLAVEKAIEQLESGKERDPARAAANLSSVKKASVDKLLSLSGRPTQITETRDISQILRSLAGKGVLELPEGDNETTD